MYRLKTLEKANASVNPTEFAIILIELELVESNFSAFLIFKSIKYFLGETLNSFLKTVLK